MEQTDEHGECYQLLLYYDEDDYVKCYIDAEYIDYYIDAAPILVVLADRWSDSRRRIQALRGLSGDVNEIEAALILMIIRSYVYCRGELKETFIKLVDDLLLTRKRYDLRKVALGLDYLCAGSAPFQWFVWYSSRRVYQQCFDHFTKGTEVWRQIIHIWKQYSLLLYIERKCYNATRCNEWMDFQSQRVSQFVSQIWESIHDRKQVRNRLGDEERLCNPYTESCLMYMREELLRTLKAPRTVLSKDIADIIFPLSRPRPTSIWYTSYSSYSPYSFVNTVPWYRLRTLRHVDQLFDWIFYL